MSSAASFYDDSPAPHLFQRWKILSAREPALLRFQQTLLHGPLIHYYDIPYLAGYNKKGTQIYIDKDVPFIVRLGGKSVCLRDFLQVHEATEKALLSKLKFSYEDSHHLATAVEYHAVEAAGIKIADYKKFLRPFIKQEYLHFKRVPPDLDLTPMKDDPALMKRLRPLMEAESKKISALFRPEAGKVSKPSVSYQIFPKNGKRCLRCSMFLPPNRCSHVSGSISPDGWCIDWERKD